MTYPPSARCQRPCSFWYIASGSTCRASAHHQAPAAARPTTTARPARSGTYRRRGAEARLARCPILRDLLNVPRYSSRATRSTAGCAAGSIMDRQTVILSCRGSWIDRFREGFRPLSPAASGRPAREASTRGQWAKPVMEVEDCTRRLAVAGPTWLVEDGARDVLDLSGSPCSGRTSSPWCCTDRGARGCGRRVRRRFADCRRRRGEADA